MSNIVLRRLTVCRVEKIRGKSDAGCRGPLNEPINSVVREQTGSEQVEIEWY